jgi:hypothetical protein
LRRNKQKRREAIETKLSKKVENQKAEKQALSEKKPFPK